MDEIRESRGVDAVVEPAGNQLVLVANLRQNLRIDLVAVAVMEHARLHRRGQIRLRRQWLSKGAPDARVGLVEDVFVARGNVVLGSAVHKKLLVSRRRTGLFAWSQTPFLPFSSAAQQTKLLENAKHLRMATIRSVLYAAAYVDDKPDGACDRGFGARSLTDEAGIAIALGIDHFEVVELLFDERPHSRITRLREMILRHGFGRVQHLVRAFPG